MAERFEVIVVGGGPAGCAAALPLAREGYDVLILEKAKVPGHRNMTGGVLYGRYVKGYGAIDLLPELEEEAPLERRVVEHRAYIISDVYSDNGGQFYRFRDLGRKSIATKLGLTGLNMETGHDYTVLRAKFDRWLARKVEEAGAMVSTGKSVEELLWLDGQVIGVKTKDEELYADVIIDASGVTSTLVEKAGLRGKLEPYQVYHGIKHVYALDPKIIEERFGVKEGEGKALFFLGDYMMGVSGGGFLYTNRNSLSIGVVVSLDSVVKKCVERPDVLGKPLELLERLEAHPAISPYLEGASLVEYSAHNIPKGPKTMLDKPYIGGFLVTGDALGAFFKLGVLIDGMRRAIASGVMAAQTYMAAKKRQDFSERSLALYKKVLGPIYKDNRRSKINGYFADSRLTYRILPATLLTLGFLARTARVAGDARTHDSRDMIQKIQDRTGLLDYDEDKVYSHISVSYKEAAASASKPWVPACPYNCYVLVLDKGVFASYKDLYLYNLEIVKRESGKGDSGSKSLALEMTTEDMKRGQVRFDHVACVSCGTCGVLGPVQAVLFGHERHGHGVKYRYG